MELLLFRGVNQLLTRSGGIFNAQHQPAAFQAVSRFFNRRPVALPAGLQQRIAILRNGALQRFTDARQPAGVVLSQLLQRCRQLRQRIGLRLRQQRGQRLQRNGLHQLRLMRLQRQAQALHVGGTDHAQGRVWSLPLAAAQNAQQRQAIGMRHHLIDKQHIKRLPGIGEQQGASRIKGLSLNAKSSQLLLQHQQISGMIVNNRHPQLRIARPDRIVAGIRNVTGRQRQRYADACALGGAELSCSVPPIRCTISRQIKSPRPLPCTA